MRVPSEIRIKSYVELFQYLQKFECLWLTARPWTMIVLTDLSITLGKTLKVEGMDVSLPGPPVVGSMYTELSVQDCQFM